MTANSPKRTTEVKTKTSLHSPVFSWKNKLARLCWGLVYHLFFRYSPRPLFAYRRWILTLFGASLKRGVNVYPSVKIWFPANLTMDEGATLGPNVNAYNQGDIVIGKNVIVSQDAYLCASTHDYNDPLHPLVLAPINIGDHTWICAEAFIGPGVSIAHGCVVGARAFVHKNTKAWLVYSGNPAVVVKERNKFE